MRIRVDGGLRRYSVRFQWLDSDWIYGFRVDEEPIDWRRIVNCLILLRQDMVTRVCKVK